MIERVHRWPARPPTNLERWEARKGYYAAARNRGPDIEPTHPLDRFIGWLMQPRARAILQSINVRSK